MATLQDIMDSWKNQSNPQSTGQLSLSQQLNAPYQTGSVSSSVSGPQSATPISLPGESTVASGGPAASNSGSNFTNNFGGGNTNTSSNSNTGLSNTTSPSSSGGVSASFLQNPIVQQYLAANPQLAALANQIAPGSPEEDLFNNISTDPTYKGTNLTPQMVNLAYNAYNAKLQPGFQQAKLADTTNVQNDIGNQNAQYQNFLAGQANQFGIDKQNLDSKAASQNGVLAGSGRAEQENNLANTYNLAAASRLASTSAGIQKSANDYASSYGSAAAGAPGLSSLYNLNTNTYNANTGQVGQGSGSTVYNPSSYGYTGTQPTAIQAQAETGAAGLLKAYNNQALGAFGAGNSTIK